MAIRIKDGEFVDEHDRILNLRGINVSGSSKVPVDGTASASDVTFVGRPFPLSDAPLHFARLRACGFALVRFIVTWEAIEHAGPGNYDEEYLEYIRAILEVAKEYDIMIYIDPHQDVWSRWTGGDGAPLWTLELAGFDVENLRECEAALTKETYGRGHSTEERESREKGKDASFPKMIWPTNYFKLACATMFTLFWAGERFAPNFTVDDEEGKKVNIQTHLQTHYINAMAELLKHLEGLDNIVGIGTMNEPSPGYINVADLSKGFAQTPMEGSTGATELKYGLAPTPFQGMCLGEGFKQSVGEWSNGLMQHVLGRADRRVEVDPKGKSAWRGDGRCIWKKTGVWRTDPKTNGPELVFPRYFANVDFGVECYLPFARNYANAMRQVWSLSSKTELLIFVELPPLEFSSTPFPEISSSPSDGLPNAVNATHWYDGVTLFTQSWKSYFSYDTRTDRPVFGYNNVFRTHASQLAEIKRLGVERMANAPTLIGECGIPYDMQHMDKSSQGGYGKCGNVLGTPDPSFDPQLAAMDHTLRCLEKNQLSFTLWNYTPDNSNEEGDRWNGEDLSIYSEEQRSGLDEADPLFVYDGLRAARAFVRPHARRVAGTPLENAFDMRRGAFAFRGRIVGEKKWETPTEIFVPKLWCPRESDMNVVVTEGRFEVEEFDHHFVVKYWCADSGGGEHGVEILGPGTRASQSNVGELPRRAVQRLPSFRKPSFQKMSSFSKFTKK